MKPIRLGMVGGGRDALIGTVHRIAARLDGRFELVAGALSSTPERAAASAADLGLARSYDDFSTMASSEADRSDGIDAVAIVTPNHLHAAAALPFLERGIHVICDKPLAADMAQAAALEEAVSRSTALFVLTHNYTAYAMIRQARAMVGSGVIGAVRIVQVDYAQDWLTRPVEREGHKQAEWRTDPARSGAGGATGDIGTHAANLACFVSGQSLDSLAADLQSFGPGRVLDDNAHVLLRFDGGARGMLWASQVAPGNENGLSLRIFGESGGLAWSQEKPDALWFTPYGAAKRLLTRNGAGVAEAARAVSRVPAGHPEGYLEGFATVYRETADAIDAVRNGASRSAAMGLLPGIDAGLDGMRFIDACVRSSARDAAWVSLSACGDAGNAGGARGA